MVNVGRRRGLVKANHAALDPHHGCPISVQRFILQRLRRLGTKDEARALRFVQMRKVQIIGTDISTTRRTRLELSLAHNEANGGIFAQHLANYTV